jgi:hypothetical protein
MMDNSDISNAAPTEDDRPVSACAMLGFWDVTGASALQEVSQALHVSGDTAAAVLGLADDLRNLAPCSSVP